MSQENESRLITVTSRQFGKDVTNYTEQATSVIQKKNIPEHNLTQNEIRNSKIGEDYLEQIDAYNLEIENQYRPQIGYLLKQPEINEEMRAILINWIVEVYEQFKTTPKTLFLTVDIIDRIIEKAYVTRKYLQLVGITALLIASKYEEISSLRISELVYVTNHAYTKQEVMEMERIILNRLSFNLSVPSRYTFLQRYLSYWNYSENVKETAEYILELTLLESYMIKYKNSMIAAASLYLAGKLTTKEKQWNISMGNKTKYKVSDLKSIVKDLIIILQKTPKNSLRSIATIFSQPKHLGVAKAIYKVNK